MHSIDLMRSWMNWETVFFFFSFYALLHATNARCKLSSNSKIFNLKVSSTSSTTHKQASKSRSKATKHRQHNSKTKNKLICTFSFIDKSAFNCNLIIIIIITTLLSVWTWNYFPSQVLALGGVTSYTKEQTHPHIIIVLLILHCKTNKQLSQIVQDRKAA